MQYALIILEGSIDESIVALDGMTPLEAACTPNIDVIAQSGRVGLCAASPTGMRPCAASATMSMLGCDPAVVDPAQGPLSALARGVETKPGDRAWRVTFLTAPDGVVSSPAAGSIDAPEARAVVAALIEAWGTRAPDLMERFTATSVDQTGCVLIERGGAESDRVDLVMPVDLVGENWRDGLSSGRVIPAIERLIEIGAEALADCEVNRARRAAGSEPVDVAWIWGGGAVMQAGHGFAERFALRGAIVAESEHAVGVGRLIGLDRVPISQGEGLESVGEAVASALDRYDLVVAHVRTPAEASFLGDVGAKVRAIEAIDSMVVGPVLRRLDRLDRLGSAGTNERDEDGFRIMIAATADSSCVDRAPLDFPSLVAMGGTWLEGQVSRRLIERDAAASDLRVEPGHEILEFFLRSGLRVQFRKPRTSRQAVDEAPE